MFVWRVHVFDIILDRKGPLLWKDIKACGHTHTQTNTDMHIHTHTHRSITEESVGIKYKDATNLQTLFSLKWATLFQLQSKDTIFLSNFVRFVLIITKLQISSTFLFFSILLFFAEMERYTSCTQSSHFIPIIINGTPIKKHWFEFPRLISSNNMECSFHSTAKKQTFIHSWIFYFNNKQTGI